MLPHGPQSSYFHQYFLQPALLKLKNGTVVRKRKPYTITYDAHHTTADKDNAKVASSGGCYILDVWNYECGFGVIFTTKLTK